MRGLLAALALVLGCAEAPRPPNIVLLVVDTVRADRLSCYGYERPTTPNIDALCERGIRFDDAWSTSSWTLPAHASLFTGRYPIEHGATQEHTRLDEALPTLAELLGERGYAVFGASANPVVSRASGLARGFGDFAETWRERGKAPPPPERHPNLLAVERFLRGVPEDRPFFVFVNYIEAHGPYDPPEPHRRRFLRVPESSPVVATARTRRPVAYYLDHSAISMREFSVLNDLYDGEIAHVDELVGALVDFLERTGRLRDTVLVLVSDHGENIGDHGHFRHVFSLYGTTVRVPLVVVLPDGRGAGSVRDDPVGLVDLFPTILGLAGVAPPAGSRGRDLLADGADAAAPPVFAEYYYPLQALELFGEDAPRRYPTQLAPHLRRLRSVEEDGLRLVWSSDGRNELFDLREDPGERRNLAGEAGLAERERHLHALLEDYVREAGGPRPLPDAATRPAPIGAFGDLDPDSAAQLRELGYLP
jgi:arylsulfatase A-like enzyme